MHKLFKAGLFIVFVICSYGAIAGVHEEYPYDFQISKDFYRFSQVYQIKSFLKETYPGSIKNSVFRLATSYDLSDVHGWQATGVTRIISLGSFYPWAKEVDIYDTRPKLIGFIVGKLATVESAKFSIYELDDQKHKIKIGDAYANRNFDRFVIMAGGSSTHAIAELNRNFSDKTWRVSVHYPQQIDDRIIRIFAGFIIDNEDKFISDDFDLDDLLQETKTNG